jgi:hypothetical protein
LSEAGVFLVGFGILQICCHKNKIIKIETPNNCLGAAGIFEK